LKQTRGRDSRTRGDAGDAELPVWLRRDGDGFMLQVHAQPGARRTDIVGEHGGRLKIALQAPPVDGRANDALIGFLADRLGMARGAVALIAGASGRDKRVRIASSGSIAAAEVVRRLLGAS
jgi:hypothetical protein